MPETKTPPAKTDIAELEPFEGLPLERIFVVRNARHAELAAEDLTQEGIVGFDTESKPTFRKGEISGGPHVFQFSTMKKAYIFQAHVTESHPTLLALMESDDVSKVGFGLKGDLQLIHQRFGMRPAATTDLEREFGKLGYRGSIGTKTAIAILFNRRLLKSKSVTTTNWAAEELTDKQLAYAANDAYAALKVYHALRDRIDGV